MIKGLGSGPLDQHVWFLNNISNLVQLACWLAQTMIYSFKFQLTLFPPNQKTKLFQLTFSLPFIPLISYYYFTSTFTIISQKKKNITIISLLVSPRRFQFSLVNDNYTIIYGSASWQRTTFVNCYCFILADVS